MTMAPLQVAQALCAPGQLPCLCALLSLAPYAGFHCLELPAFAAGPMRNVDCEHCMCSLCNYLPC